MEIKIMTRAHAEAVADLEQRCFSDPWSVNSILAEIDNALSLWLVAIADEQVIGYIGSQSVLGWADMMNLAVSPEHRRESVARALVMELIQQLRQKEVTCLTLEVRASNQPAISLYTQLGFDQVGRRKNYYHHPKEDALILRKEWQL